MSLRRVDMKAFAITLGLSFGFLFSSAGFALDKSVYDFDVKTIKGKTESLSAYKGKVLLIDHRLPIERKAEA